MESNPYQIYPDLPLQEPEDWIDDPRDGFLPFYNLGSEPYTNAGDFTRSLSPTEALEVGLESFDHTTPYLESYYQVSDISTQHAQQGLLPTTCHPTTDQSCLCCEGQIASGRISFGHTVQAQNSDSVVREPGDTDCLDPVLLIPPSHATLTPLHPWISKSDWETVSALLTNPCNI